MEELLKKIEEVKEQQKKLQFESFSEETAWKIGSRLHEEAEKKGYPIAISISLNRRRMFYSAMEGTAPINDRWIERKENTVYKFFKSSYEMSLYMKIKGDTIGNRYGLKESDYAAAGGGFPITIKGAGVVGCIAVSGLKDYEDHGLVVSVIKEFL